jgi:hypothetical protein
MQGPGGLASCIPQGFQNFSTNFDSYGNVLFDPCEFTLHTAANAENND